MVRIPSLRRSETAPAQDENHDGRIDERDARLSDDTTRVTEPIADSRQTGPRRTGDRDKVVTPDQADETTTYRSRTAAAGATGTAATAGTTATAAASDDTRGGATTIEQERDRTATGRPATDRPATATGTARPASPPNTTRDPDTGRDPDADRGPEIAVVPGPRPRASLLATLSLIVGVAAALFVLTGALAGYGIGLGALALLLSIGGISATGRRHIAGKSDALIGLALGLGAVVVGILAMTGQFAWPSSDVDTVQRFREWLDSQFVDRF